MTESTQAYLRDFASSARASGLPGPRIGEAITDIEQHVADTGEHPEDSFGDPQTYAAALARGLPPQPVRPFARRAAPVLGLLAGGMLTTQGAIALTNATFARIGPSVLVPLLAAVTATLLFAPAYRRRPRTDDTPWLLSTLFVFVLGVAVTSGDDTGIAIPAWLAAGLGTALVLGAIVATLTALPRMTSIVDPFGRDRSALTSRYVSGRFLLAATFIVCTVIVVSTALLS
jgi:hypothetical protein